MKGLIDTYTLRARILPALLTVFPLLVAGAIAVPASFAGPGRSVLSLAVTCGALVMLGHMARALGVRKERALLQEWDEMPTTRWLRHRDRNLDGVTKSRYRAFLDAHVTGLSLPTEAAERLEPAAADEVYRSAAAWLREYTRDKSRYGLVFDENVNYGFARNMLALKPWALIIAAGVLIGVSARAYLEYRNGRTFVAPEYLMTGVVALIWSAGWAVFVSTGWVTRVSEAYARALLAACDAPAAVAK